MNITKTLTAAAAAHMIAAQKTFTPRTREQGRKNLVKHIARADRYGCETVRSGSADYKACVEFCRVCPPGFEVDHIKALADGGANRRDNLRYLIKEENRRLGGMMSPRR